MCGLSVWGRDGVLGDRGERGGGAGGKGRAYRRMDFINHDTLHDSTCPLWRGEVGWVDSYVVGYETPESDVVGDFLGSDPD